MFLCLRAHLCGVFALCLSLVVFPVIAFANDRDAVFARLLEAPNDPEIMLEYARIAIDDRDYEAALATLERMIDLYPQSQEARFELAVAYFALGIDDVAQYHLDIYTDRAQLTPAEEARARSYEEALGERLEPFSFSGYIQGDVIYRADTSDFGSSVTLSFDTRFDMGGARADEWLTSVRLFGVSFPEDPDDDSVRVVMRTGPSFAIDGTSFGTRLQPYLSLDYVDDSGGEDSGFSLGAGLFYIKPLNPDWTVYVDAEAGTVDRPDGGIDSTYLAADLGAIWQATNATAYRFTLRYLEEDADAGGVDSDLVEAGIGLDHETTISIFGRNLDATASGFLRIARESSSDGIVDDVISFGANMRTYLSASVYLDAGIQRFTRSSSDPFFDEEDTIITVGAGWEF